MIPSVRGASDEWFMVSSERTTAAVVIQRAFRRNKQGAAEARAASDKHDLPCDGISVARIAMTTTSIGAMAMLFTLQVIATPSPKPPNHAAEILALGAGARPPSRASTALVLPVSLHDPDSGSVPRLLGMMALWLMSYTYAHIMDPPAVEAACVRPTSQSSVSPTTLPIVVTKERSKAPNDWNEFQRIVGGCGLQRRHISALYAKLKHRSNLKGCNHPHTVSATSLLLENSSS